MGRRAALVDRLLAPYRRPHVVGDVSIHEVCERVRTLILAVLNIAHNACQALAERIAHGDAELVLRTRIARQVTFGKQRYRLALACSSTSGFPNSPLTAPRRMRHWRSSSPPTRSGSRHSRRGWRAIV